MIKAIRELTGLSHQKLGAWLGVSKSMVQFAEFGDRTLQGDASKKLALLELTIQQLKDKPKPQLRAQVAYADPACFAKQHAEKLDHHLYQAGKLQRQLNLLMQQHDKLVNGLALLEAMKDLDTQLTGSTQKDKHIAGLLASFSVDKIKQVCKKMELLDDRMNTHLAYAEVHKQKWEQLKG